MLIGAAIGLALGVLAASGVLAMAMWVAATEQDRFCQEECIDDAP